MKQLGKIDADLSCLRFGKIGFLFEDNDCFIVKRVLRPSVIWPECSLTATRLP